MYAVVATDFVIGKDPKMETIYAEDEAAVRQAVVDLHLSRFRDTSLAGDHFLRICNENKEDKDLLIEKLYVFFRSTRSESYTVDFKAVP